MLDDTLDLSIIEPNPSSNTKNSKKSHNKGHTIENLLKDLDRIDEAESSKPLKITQKSKSYKSKDPEDFTAAKLQAENQEDIAPSPQKKPLESLIRLKFKPSIRITGSHNLDSQGSLPTGIGITTTDETQMNSPSLATRLRLSQATESSPRTLQMLKSFPRPSDVYVPLSEANRFTEASENALDEINSINHRNKSNGRPSRYVARSHTQAPGEDDIVLRSFEAKVGKRTDTEIEMSPKLLPPKIITETNEDERSDHKKRRTVRVHLPKINTSSDMSMNGRSSFEGRRGDGTPKFTSPLERSGLANLTPSKMRSSGPAFNVESSFSPKLVSVSTPKTMGVSPPVRLLEGVEMRGHVKKSSLVMTSSPQMGLLPMGSDYALRSIFDRQGMKDMSNGLDTSNQSSGERSPRSSYGSQSPSSFNNEGRKNIGRIEDHVSIFKKIAENQLVKQSTYEN